MEFTTQNSVKVKIGVADFEDVMALKAAIAREIATSNFTLPFDLDKGTDQDIDVGTFVKLIALVDSSRPVYDALFKCLAKSTYDGESIRTSTFSDMAAREAYYDIVAGCLKVNISPFFKGLLSKFAPMLAKFTTAMQTRQGKSQKSE